MVRRPSYRYGSGLPIFGFLTRDDCETCSDQRDEHGRLPIGWCGSDCLMAKIKRGETPASIRVGYS